MLDRKYLFELLRNAPFGGTLKQAQVTGVTLILDVCEKLGMPLHFIAYILATAFHETGGTMKPISENLNYTAQALIAKFSRSRISVADANKYGRTSKQKANQSAIANLIYGGAWGLRNLGNRLAGDGWRFIGRGFVQLTGRRNYEIYGVADTPSKATDPDTAAYILVKGMLDGVFTTRKLDDYVKGGVFDPVAARAIVNGTDKASLIARHYDAIHQALLKAQLSDTVKPGGVLEAQLKDVSEVPTEDVSATKSPIAQTVYGIAGTGVVGSAVAAVTTPWAAIVLVAFLAIGGVFLWGHLTGKFEFKKS